MQYSVPQFTDVEDKLIGPLTLKQFLVVLAFGGLDLMLWSLLKFSIFFFLFAIPITLVGLGLTFARFNGRPVYGYLGAFISFVAKPQARIFKREEPNMVINFKKEKIKPVVEKISQVETESRLRKLAYLLDQKTEEEKE